MKSILIVDDSEGDQFYTEIILKGKNGDIRILKAYDGKEALEILEKDQPDLILLDINMPGMNGHEFLEIYSEDNEREIPVVVMLTSSDQERDKDQAMEYKCVKDYLLKPIKEENIEHLESLVEDSLKAA